MILGIVITVILGIGGIFAALSIIGIYNSMVSLEKNIQKAWANIDVLLTQRHDELTKLLGSVQGLAKFEKTTFAEIAKARSAYATAQTVQEKAEANNMITTALKSLFAVTENYPQLKANEAFMQLQSRITALESQIADRREFYNDSVNTFNTRIDQFPYALIANMKNYTQKEMFKATEEQKRDVDIKIEI